MPPKPLPPFTLFTMRNALYLLAVAGLSIFSGCDSKKAEETKVPAIEDATSATDIAETTASPIDTARVLPDSAAVDTVSAGAVQ